ncbi:hypothetical protein EJB05_09529, partial [Eragrostis curvula]
MLESPQWLAMRGRHGEAHTVHLRRVSDTAAEAGLLQASWRKSSSDQRRRRMERAPPLKGKRIRHSMAQQPSSTATASPCQPSSRSKAAPRLHASRAQGQVRSLQTLFLPPSSGVPILSFVCCHELLNHINVLNLYKPVSSLNIYWGDVKPQSEPEVTVYQVCRADNELATAVDRPGNIVAKTR